MDSFGDSYKNRLMRFRSFVLDLKGLSKCKKKHVACIVCDKDLQQIYSIGINGTARGYKKDCLCVTNSKYSCVHAEANALIKLQTTVPNKVLICSLMPCSQCASMIVNEPGGFDAVLWIDDWKEHGAVGIFEDAGIHAGKLLIGGDIEWYTLEASEIIPSPLIL